MIHNVKFWLLFFITCHSQEDFRKVAEVVLEMVSSYKLGDITMLCTGSAETCIPTLPSFDEVTSLAEICSSSLSPNASNCSVGVADSTGSTFIFPELFFTCNASILAWRVARENNVNQINLQIWRKVDIFRYALGEQVSLLSCNGGPVNQIMSNVYQCSLDSSIDVREGDLLGFRVVPVSTNGLYFDLSEADQEELAGYQDRPLIDSFPRNLRVPVKTIPKATPLLALKLKTTDTPTMGSTIAATSTSVSGTENHITTEQIFTTRGSNSSDKFSDKKFELVLGAEITAGVVVGAVLLVICFTLVIGIQCSVIIRHRKKKRRLRHSDQNTTTTTNSRDSTQTPEPQTIFLESLRDHYEIIKPDQDGDNLSLHKNASYGSNLALAVPDPEPEYWSLKAKPEPMYDSASLAESGTEEDEMNYSNPRIFTHTYSSTSIPLSVLHGSASNNGSDAELNMLSRSNRSLNSSTHHDHPNIKTLLSSNASSVINSSEMPQSIFGVNSDDSEPDYY